MKTLLLATMATLHFMVQNVSAQSVPPCVPVEKHTVTYSGAYNQGAGVGVKEVNFCFNERACGGYSEVYTEHVCDYGSVEWQGVRSFEIGCGDADTSSVNITELDLFETRTYAFGKFGSAAFVGPITVLYTPDSIYVTKISPTAYLGQGHMLVEFAFPGTFSYRLRSNEHMNTVWKVTARPKFECANYVPVSYVVYCNADLVALSTPCPNIDNVCSWYDASGFLIGAGSNVAVESVPATYTWVDDCNSGSVVVMPLDSVYIESTEVLCTNRTKLFLPPGIRMDWYNQSGEFVGNGNAVEVDKKGTYYAKFTGNSCVFESNKIYVDGTWNNFDFTVTVHPGDTVMLDAGTYIFATSNAPDPNTVMWEYRKNGAETEKIYGAGRYEITARFNDCEVTKQLLILDSPMEDCPGIQVYKPNIFCPNCPTDATFNVKPENGGVVKRLQVYNRWGQLVFQSFDGSDWDGMVNGKMGQPDTYVYFATVELDIIKCDKVKGGVTLWLEGARN